VRCIPLSTVDKKPLEEWIKKSERILEDMKAEDDDKKRKAIIHRNKRHWRDKIVIDFLKNLSDGKCWYTEARFSAEYPHLEHFRPKICARDENWKKCHEGYWWLAFDLENYRLSKPMPNTKKGTYFPLRERCMAVCQPGISVSRESPMFLDPLDAEDVELIGFNALGMPEPCANPVVELDDWDKQRVEFSIKKYGLANPDLVDQRKSVWNSLVALFNEYHYYTSKSKKEQCKVSKGEAKRIAIELKGYLDPRREFTALVRDCFDQHPVGKLLFKTLSTTHAGF
jgi:hypothetical protein|tara:strand:- start:446 stop:1294 length:849 start_codon:yes stop_codon:yes gene_type:complete